MMTTAPHTSTPLASLQWIETGFTKAWQPAEKALREALDAVPTWHVSERILITSLKAMAWMLIVLSAAAIHTAAFWVMTLRLGH
jgi:hypothetical protein